MTNSPLLLLPAIDLRAGCCVRLTQGDYSREKVYSADPAEVAKGFEEQGAQYLHVVDLDGAKEGRPINLAALTKIRNRIKIPIEFGGGIRSVDHARQILDLGINRVIIGSKIVQDRSLAATMFQELGDRAVAGLDAREGRVAITGWTQTSDLAATDLARQLEQEGAQRFIVTDIARDGALSGPNLDFFEEMAASVKSPVIASGGVSCLEDIAKLKTLPIEGVIIGKALYEHRFTVAEALEIVNAAGPE